METTAASRLKRYREELDETQAEFGGRLGITPNHLSALEHGRLSPSGTLKLLIELLTSEQAAPIRADQWKGVAP